MTNRPSLDEIFGAAAEPQERPSLDAIFKQAETTSSTATTIEQENQKIKPSIFEMSARDIRQGLGEPANFGLQWARTMEDKFENWRQRTMGAGLSAVNAGLLGVPEIITQKLTGRRFVPNKAPVANAIGQIGGFAGGVPGSILRKIAAPAGVGLGQKLIRGAAEGVAGGLSMLPTPEQAPTMREAKQQLGTQAKVGAALGAAAPLLQLFPKIFNLGGAKTAQKIAEKADSGFDTIAKNMSDKYDDFFANVKGTTKVDDILTSVDDALDQFPEGANVGKLQAIQKRLKELKDAGGEINAKELHNLKQEIRKTIPKSVWNGVSDGDAITNTKENIYWKISEKLESLGGEKYKGLTEEYKQFKNTERLARKMFYRQGVPSNAPLSGTYDIPTKRAIKSLDEMLPPEQKFQQAFEAWRRGQAVKKAATATFIAGGGLGILGGMVRGKRN